MRSPARPNRSRGVATLLGALLVTCATPQNEGASLVSRIGAPVLVGDAELLEKYASSAVPVVVPQASWPTAVRELQPQEVRVVMEGVFVRRWKRFVEEEGVFIAFAGVNVDTGSGGDPSFSPLAPRVYWYKVKG
jgi:hypothetical protein